MRQQVNLYRPVENDDHKPLASRTAALLAGGVLLCLLAIWAYGAHQVAGLEQAVQALRLQQQQQQAAMSASASLTANLNPVQLQAHVKALEAQLTARRQALELLRAGGAGQRIGFAAPMEALARQHTEGLWIDRVVLSGITGAMSVEGSTVSPDLVPRYLRALGGEPALTGIRFDQLTIERATLEATAVDGDKPVKAAADRKNIRFHADSASLRLRNPEKPS